MNMPPIFLHRETTLPDYERWCLAICLFAAVNRAAQGRFGVRYAGVIQI